MTPLALQGEPRGALLRAILGALLGALLGLGAPGAHAQPMRVEPAALPRPGEFALVGAGDIADCRSGGDEKTAPIVEQVLAASTNAWAFTAGDNAYEDGSDDEFARCYAPTWGRFKARTLATPGNHDYNTKNATGFSTYFGVKPTGPGPAAHGYWRAVDVGAWRVLLLDSNCPPPNRSAARNDPVDCGPESAQVKWLLEQLRSAGTRCSVVIWHHPRWSSGSHGNDPRVDALWNAAVRGGADVAIAGHDHHYERFAPITGWGDLPTAGPRGTVPLGMPSFVVGTGGRLPYPLRSEERGSAVRLSGTHGVLVLLLDEKSARYRFVTADGSVRDSGTITCR